MAIALKSFVTAQDAIFTVANTDSQVIGSSLLNQTVRLQQNADLASGVFLDANIENIELRGSYSDYKFVVIASGLTAGLQIQNATANFGTIGTVVAIIPNINNLSVALKFFDGSVSLAQTGNNAFTLNGASVVVDTTPTTPVATPTGATTTVTYTAGTADTPADTNLVSKSFVTGGDTSGGTAATPTTTAAGGNPAIFTVADHDVKVKGGTGGNEVVRIQAGVTGVTLDANIERVELSAALATYEFVTVAGTGLQIKNKVGGATVATIPSINQAVKIAFTDGSATLVQTGIAAFTLNTVALAVDPNAAATPNLTGHELVTSTGERSALGLHVTAATIDTDITTVFTEYPATSGTSNTAATVVATGMSSTEGGQLDAVAAKVNQIAAGGITGVMDLTAAQGSSELTALFSKDDVTADATVVATGMATGTAGTTPTSQIAVLVDNVGKIANNQISGAIGLTGAQFTILHDTANTATNNKLATGATLTVVEDTVLGADVLDTMNLASSNLVTATTVTRVDGTATQIKAVTDAMVASGDGILLDGLMNLYLTTAAASDTFSATAFTQDGLTIHLADADNALTILNSVVNNTKTLKIDGTALTDPHRLVFDGSNEAGGSFSVTGGAGTDSIVGGAGSDTIDGGANDDTITGGAGTDAITVSAGTDTITDFDAIADTLSISAGATAKVTFAGDALATYNPVTNNGVLDITIAASATSSTVTGSAGSDSITGSDGTDSIDGGAGSDTINGGANDDTITGGTDSDVITVGAGTDTITDFTVGEDTLTILAGAIAKVDFDGGTSIDYTVDVTNGGILDIIISAGSSTVVGSAGSDSIHGSAGTDDIRGGAGSDTIDGGADSDTITGAGGSDTFNVTGGTDTITDWTAGEDTLNISSGATAKIVLANTGSFDYSTITAGQNAGTLFIDGGSVGASTITGSSGNDSIVGSVGSDSITGGAGSDTILGGAGSDTIDGGLGNDTIHITHTGEIITINEFTTGDLLVFPAGANFNIINDNITNDNKITLLMNNPTDGMETTIIFTGTTAVNTTNDAAVWNVPTFNSTFGNVIPIV